MVAVVTGAAGFIGRALVARLAERGPVVGIDRAPMPRLPGVTSVRADLLDRVATGPTLAGAQVVYHLAGSPDVRDARPDTQWRRWRDNVLATRAVLASVPPDVPLLVTSSSSVYGGGQLGRASVESDTPRPVGGYARSKLHVEWLCAERAQAGGLVTVLRPFTVAGEGQRPGMALARWIDAARAGRPLPVLGDLSRTRDITDVRHVVRAMIELVGTPVVANVGTGVGHTLGELAAAVRAVLGSDTGYEIGRPHPDEVAHTLADTALLLGVLGWVPRTDLATLVQRQAAASARSSDGRSTPDETHGHGHAASTLTAS